MKERETNASDHNNNERTRNKRIWSQHQQWKNAKQAHLITTSTMKESKTNTSDHNTNNERTRNKRIWSQHQQWNNGKRNASDDFTNNERTQTNASDHITNNERTQRRTHQITSPTTKERKEERIWSQHHENRHDPHTALITKNKQKKSPWENSSDVKIRKARAYLILLIITKQTEISRCRVGERKEKGKTKIPKKQYYFLCNVTNKCKKSFCWRSHV